MIHVCRIIIYFSIKLFFRTKPRPHIPTVNSYTCSPEVKERRPGSVWLVILCIFIKKKNKDSLHLSLVSWDQIVTKILRTGKVGGIREYVLDFLLLPKDSGMEWKQLSGQARPSRLNPLKGTAGGFSSIQMKVFHDQWWRSSLVSTWQGSGTQ